MALNAFYLNKVKRLLIVSHVQHFLVNGQLCAYGAYAREIDIWCDLFPEVVVAAPFRHEPPPADCLPFSRKNVRFHPIRETGGETFMSKLHQLLLLPYVCLRLMQAMWWADAIHVRCPGNLGLLGTILGPLFSRRLVAKYAGNWLPYPGEPASSGLQRWLLSSAWWRGPVTVYGDWPNQSKNIVPFFTSIMDRDHIARAKLVAARTRRHESFQIVFVGRLSKAKNVDVLLQAVSRLDAENIPIRCDIIGVGPERDRLEELSAELGISHAVRFVGGLEFEEVLEHYEQADALVLVSETEGWPKAIAEAMAFGVVCIGSSRGLVPWILGDGRGVVVPPGDLVALTGELKRLALSPDLQRSIGERAAAWGQSYSLESLRDALRELLTTRWHLQDRIPPPRCEHERPLARNAT